MISRSPNLRTSGADGDLLQHTLSQAVRDEQTVTPAGEHTGTRIHGMTTRELITHADERGSLVEMFDLRWEWHPDPLVSAYAITDRPGYAKGWNLHKLHEDRYMILQGEMELVLYDVRPDSPTRGQVCKVMLSEYCRRLVNVPANVWHADHNVGTKDVLLVNFPTTPYNHANPDKYRLPLDTPLIPYSFGDVSGW